MGEMTVETGIDTSNSAWRQRGEPDPVDIHVGGRIRMRRILLGKSQETVAAQVGVSFQQLQKYESGANRVSASRLFDVAHILSAPVSFFFDDMPPELAGPADLASARDKPSANLAMTDRVTLDLIRDFHRIPTAQQRRCILDLVRAIAEGNPPT
ncbi:MAG TPA: helix-turn-helix domain-containing protein [Stellaceae bacterium]|nr:helix-turn-helix domain-containing protein [Stellaceae bacterium]